MWLQIRMFLLVAVLFGILYGVITGIGTWMGCKLMELFTTHPNMFKRIKHLPTLSV